MATHGVLRFMRVCFTRKKPKVSQRGFREDISMRRPLYLILTETKKTPEQEQTTKSFLVIYLYIPPWLSRKTLVFQEST